MASILIGYDVESLDPRIIEGWVKGVMEVHRGLEAPATFFMRGETLIAGLRYIRRLMDFEDLFDFQQHTYSHILLKTVVQENEEGVKVFKGGSLRDLEEDIDKASRLLRELLGVNCIGLRGPVGYYRGLSDRPDVLELIYRLGIRFTSTYARNERDWQPVSMNIQPYWYEPQGYPDILEIPVQDWQDCIWRARYGWDRRQEYIEHLKSVVDHIAGKELVWGFATHDWSCLREDPELKIMKELISYAREKEIQILSYKDYYRKASLMKNLKRSEKSLPLKV